MNAALSQRGSRKRPSLIRLLRRIDDSLRPSGAAATVSRKLPNKASAMPTEQIRRYFHVASSER